MIAPLHQIGLPGKSICVFYLASISIPACGSCLGSSRIFQSDPGFKITIAITIPIEKLIRINLHSILIAESDPDFTGKIDQRF
jgi:hypothetical protein